MLDIVLFDTYRENPAKRPRCLFSVGLYIYALPNLDCAHETDYLHDFVQVVVKRAVSDLWPSILSFVTFRLKAVKQVCCI